MEAMWPEVQQTWSIRYPKHWYLDQEELVGFSRMAQAVRT